MLASYLYSPPKCEILCWARLLNLLSTIGSSEQNVVMNHVRKVKLHRSKTENGGQIGGNVIKRAEPSSRATTGRPSISNGCNRLDMIERGIE